tara:strand:+ start:3657 stop:5147 length:1491 start_codon:yes stop_codon:yes gene_type:complete
MEDRHKFGTVTLILAVLSFFFTAFSIGAPWATVDTDKSTEFTDDEGELEYSVKAELTGDFNLKEIDSVLEITFLEPNFGTSTELFTDTKSYEDIAQSTEGDVKTTFEDMDRAGSITSLMIWTGIIALLITAVLSVCSLGNLTNSRLTTVSGGFSAGLIVLAPIVWYILLPSSGNYAYADDGFLGSILFSDEYTVSFEPSPSTGFILSILGAMCSIGMIGAIYYHNQADHVTEKPNWMKAIYQIVSQDEQDIAKPPTFTERKEQVGLLINNYITKYKSNRRMQIASVIVVAVLSAYPIYSVVIDWTQEENAYQRDLNYAILGQGDWIEWFSVQTEIGDGETVTLLLTEADFPEDASVRNIIGLELSIDVLDNSGDNEESTGVGCLADPGEDAPDSVAYTAETPNGSVASQVESSEVYSFYFLDLPSLGSESYVTGYTVAELEKMFDTSNEIMGNYDFSFTANAEEGDSTLQCERTDSSVTIRYSIYLRAFDAEFVEV